MRRLETWVTGLTAVTSLLMATCTFDRTGVPVPGERCGDGVRQSTELCDGADLGGAGCTILGFAGGTLRCTAACSWDTTSCTAPTTCGNGQLDPGEACDDGNQVACDGCTPACRVETCGNGVRECAEACDDGNQVTGDGCTPACTIEMPAQCGNGTVEPGEVCEPGHVTETCPGLGLGEGVVTCRPDCLDLDTSGCRRPDGQACTDDDQCAGGLCFTEASSGWPAGFCTRDCSGDGTCGTGFVCAQAGSGDFCYQLCADPGDCRPGYACFDNPFDTDTTVCRPHCESAAECSETGTCNTYLGYCNLEGGDGAYGEPCEDRYDCQGWCWANPTYGYCFGLCELSTGFCPQGAVCVDAFDGATADEGLCLAACEPDGASCPQMDQTCGSYAGGPNACWPSSTN